MNRLNLGPRCEKAPTILATKCDNIYLLRNAKTAVKKRYRQLKSTSLFHQKLKRALELRRLVEQIFQPILGSFLIQKMMLVALLNFKNT